MHAMMSLARRGVEMGTSMHEEYQKFEYKMPAYGFAILIITSIMYLVTMSLVGYTFDRLIPALVMVESPQAILFEPIKNDPDASLESKVEQELLLVKQEPITSSFKKTLKHLRANAGRFSHFRGLRAWVVYRTAKGLSTSFLVTLIPSFLMPSVSAPVLSALLLANINMAWTHIVISEASDKSWYKRVPSMKLWKKVAGPTALVAIAEKATTIIPTALAISFGLDEFNHKGAKDLSSSDKQALVLKALAVFASAMIMSICVFLPAHVALTRVQASLLSDDVETIVPFDRSFSGKVVPEIVGGSGVVSVCDALTTFDWSARLRLMKTYVKAFFMQMFLTGFFLVAITVQLFLIIGVDNMKKIGESQNRQGSSPDEIILF